MDSIALYIDICYNKHILTVMSYIETKSYLLNIEFYIIFQEVVVLLVYIEISVRVFNFI